MIKIKEAIIVEGKYDKMRVKPLFDTVVIDTGGFRIFGDEKKRRGIYCNGAAHICNDYRYMDSFGYGDGVYCFRFYAYG